MPIKVGTVPKKLPYSKIYLGNILKYQSAQLIQFTTNIFPIAWTKVNNYSYSSYNIYGEWGLSHGYTNIYMNQPICNAIDGSTSTYSMYKDDSSKFIFEIALPENVSIKPSSFYLNYKYMSSTSYVEGFNPKNNSWEQLCKFSGTGATVSTEEVAISTDNFYTKFRINASAYSSSYNIYIYEFKLSSGVLKISNSRNLIYGDGSLNTESLGYEGVLKLNDEVAHYTTASTKYSGNFRISDASNNSNENNIENIMKSVATVNTQSSKTKILSGTNTYSLSVDASEEDVVLFQRFDGGGMTSSVSIGALKYCINDVYYTLEEMVARGFIKPIVIIASNASNGSYYFPNVLNLYSGGNTGTGSYAAALIVFTLNKGHKITGFELYSSKAFNTTYDGTYWYQAAASNYDLTIK